MNKLARELQRLYCLPGHDAVADQQPIALLGENGDVRCIVISLANGSAWVEVAALYQGIQDELDLPAPAISVSLEEGFQIWFSLDEPVALPLAQEFLTGLVGKYLADIKADKLKLRPGLTAVLHCVPQVPAKHATADCWSAYIDPSMGSMFAKETWLEMTPSLDKQAGMPAGLKSISNEAFRHALATLAPASVSVGNAQQTSAAAAENTRTMAISAGQFNNPMAFLLAVMNDQQANVEHRIQAASALLPYIGNDTGK